ncbi:MAG: AAA family ATPase [Chloroflexi bacterium]|nr:AAA family ATPase [Chloroflexota bacterium]
MAFGVAGKGTAGSVVAIEEPEIHLHPESQLKLSELLVSVAQKRDLQLLITTHSEHILFALLTCIAKGDLSLDDFTLHYFGPEPGKHKQLVVTESGAVEGGLPGFLDAEIEAFRKLLKAHSLQK